MGQISLKVGILRWGSFLAGNLMDLGLIYWSLFYLVLSNGVALSIQSFVIFMFVLFFFFFY